MAKKFEKYNVKTTARLNVRAKGSLEAEVVDIIPNGTEVEIIGHSADGSFGRIAPNKYIKLEFCERV